MAAFSVQIGDLLGTFDDTQMMTDALIASGTEIIKLTPNERLLKIAKESNVTSSGLAVSDEKVLEVYKSNLVAREIPLAQLAKTKDTGSIYYATANDPAFYFKTEKVYIVADGNETSGTLLHVPLVPQKSDGTIILHSHTESDISNFPIEADKLMVLGAAIRCLKGIIGTQIATDEDTELAQGSLAQLQLLEASYDKELQKYLA